MKRLALAALLALSLAALPAFASAAGFDNWPTKYTFGDGTELAATANIAYDYNDFSSGSGIDDDDAVRRRLREEGRHHQGGR